MSDWLVVLLQRRSGHERLVAAGENCYRPVYRERVVTRGVKRHVERPLLGHYLLVEMVGTLCSGTAAKIVEMVSGTLGRFINWIDQFHKIRQTPDISGVLMCDEKPLVARQHEVDRLKGSESGGFVPCPHSRVWFKVDQPVRIESGPMAWFMGRWKRKLGILDVVEIELFGSKREVKFPPGTVVAA